MKKLFITFVFLTMAIMSFSQGFKPTYYVADTAEKFKARIESGNLVYVVSTHTMYELATSMGIGKNMGYVLASSARYNYPAISSASSITTATTLTVGTTLVLPGATTITKTSGNGNSATTSGSLVVGGNDTLTTTHVAATTATISTTLTLPGGKTITKTADNGNSATTSGSLYVGNGNDTLTSTVINGSTKIYTPLSVPNQIKAGSTLLADTINFGTDASGSRNIYARKKITGIVAGDFFAVVPVMTTTSGKPGTAEFLGYYTATDSIVVSRNTATTAGLKVAVIRIAK
jgi:hypothetical protein